ELIDTDGKKQSVLREDVEEMVASRKSVMPEGFEKLLSKQEFADLLTFLTDRGKFLPIDISKVASAASDRGMFFAKGNDVERLIFPDWKPKTFKGVPFVLLDPQDGTVPNTILLNGPASPMVQRMPKKVELPLNGPARAIHFLGGVGGWAYPYSRNETVSVIVRLHYADGTSEDHELKNGIHFADYIRRVDVKGSEFAFQLRGQQIRYLAVMPKRSETIARIEFIKGPDGTAPVIMAITAEAP
ncbi:MAG: glycosyl hydrolase, partial [Planctomycetaceae bacterium]